MDAENNGAAKSGLGKFDFDAVDSPQLLTIPVRYKGYDYVLIEALEDAVAQWRNSQLAGAKLQQEGNSEVRTVSMGGMADSQPLLVSLCLFRADASGNLQLDPNGNVDTRFRVALGVIKKWPTRIVTPLFDWIMEVSGLTKKETVESLDKQIGELQARRDRLARAADKDKEPALTEEEMQAKN